MNVLVVGAGVVGLAAGRALAMRGHDVIVAERESSIGSGVSSRNSEVIHGGMYYPSGSVRARHCVTGVPSGAFGFAGVVPCSDAT